MQLQKEPTKKAVLLNPANINTENTVRMVPTPEYQIPFLLSLNKVRKIPVNTPTTPIRNIIKTKGICNRLCRYLNFSIETNKKNTRNGKTQTFNTFFDFKIIFSFSIELIKYIKAKILDKKNIASPSERFVILKAASSPR
jgi:hypothetical protein